MGVVVEGAVWSDRNECIDLDYKMGRTGVLDEAGPGPGPPQGRGPSEELQKQRTDRGAIEGFEVLESQHYDPKAE